MSARLDYLRQAADDALCAGLPQSLKDAIRDAVRAGGAKRAIMAAVYRAAGRRSLTTLGASAWCDRMLREYA